MQHHNMPTRRPASCDAAPWYEAPVIVGGSGGSGTRGMAMLLEALGVGMACVTKDFLLPEAQQPADRACTDLRCNAAADCGLISSFRTGRAVGGHGVMSWLRQANNGSYVMHKLASCAAVDERALSDALGRKVDKLCGGHKEEALRRLRHAINPKYRQPLRWGLKNPHSTYYVNTLRRIFPCMVYVNTMRDLDVMVRKSDHFESRVTEAIRYGVVTEEAARHVRGNPLNSQKFLGFYLRRVNGGLHRWLDKCMPGQFAHVSLQRLVVRGHGHHATDPADAERCFDAVMRPLLRALQLPPSADTLNATRSFLARSLPTVHASLAEASRQPLRVEGDAKLVQWPPPLETHACRGSLLATKRERY